MKEEADLLDVTRYFDGGVYGAQDDYKAFSKRMLIERIISEAGFRGDEFLGFGDGYVEIENVKQVGGLAVGVATDEPECLQVDQWKRHRLTGVGADYIIPNYLCQAELSDAIPCLNAIQDIRPSTAPLRVLPLAERTRSAPGAAGWRSTTPPPPFEHPDLPPSAARLAAAQAAAPRGF